MLFGTGIAVVSTIGAVIVAIIDRNYAKANPDRPSVMLQNMRSSESSFEVFDSIKSFGKVCVFPSEIKTYNV